MVLILWWEQRSICKGEKVKEGKGEKIREVKSERKEKMTAPADERAGMVQSGFTRMTRGTR